MKHSKHSHHARGSHHGDPDRGPPMHEGAHHWDKGYQSDEKEFSPETHAYAHQRGNQYFKMQNEAVKKDSAKISRSKFSKIA